MVRRQALQPLGRHGKINVILFYLIRGTIGIAVALAAYILAASVAILNLIINWGLVYLIGGAIHKKQKP